MKDVCPSTPSPPQKASLGRAVFDSARSKEWTSDQLFLKRPSTSDICVSLVYDKANGEDGTLFCTVAFLNGSGLVLPPHISSETKVSSKRVGLSQFRFSANGYFQEAQRGWRETLSQMKIRQQALRVLC